MNWYPKKGSSGQGLVIDEKTGANIAVAYDNAHVELLAAAPALLAALQRIMNAHNSGNNGAFMGEAVVCRAFADEANEAIRAAKGGAS